MLLSFTAIADDKRPAYRKVRGNNDNEIYTYMAQYAVDIVLLPSDEMMQRSVELNRKLVKINPPKIELNMENCIPHISLSMGVLNESDLERFKREMDLLSRRHSPLLLKCVGIYAVEIPTGEKVAGIAIETSKELYDLHKDVMTVSNRYLKATAVPEMVYSPPPVEEITLHFINTYATQSAYENFKPHITLGIGELASQEFVEEFTASTMALFHLGNYCTCRRRIYEVRLGTN